MHEDRSRKKFTIALVAMGLIAAGFGACHWSPGLHVVYGEFCMSVLGAASIFSGSDVLSKWRKPSQSPPTP